MSDASTPTISQDRRWRVYCSQFASCRWAGYRMALTRAEAVEKRCPRCGEEVVS